MPYKDFVLKGIRVGGSVGSMQSDTPLRTLYNQSSIGALLATCGQSNPQTHAATEIGRILFMDDDEHIRTLTHNQLENMGYICDLAKNGEEAIQLYRRRLDFNRSYDAVVMDLTIIGGMGGEETFRVLRAMHPGVCAIIASGHANEDMTRQFLAMGFSGYLTKPYRVSELGETVRKVLGR